MNSFRNRCAVLAAVLMICGCYHPYPNQGWHRQPGYYPAQPGQLQAPGQLYVPKSDDTQLAPGTPAEDYDSERDDFSRGDGSFYRSDDGGVPDPHGNGGRGPDDDFNRSPNP